MKAATQDDIDWLMGLGEAMYGDLLANVNATRSWLEKAIISPSSLVLRAEHSAIICTCSVLPFHGTPQASVYLFAGKPFEILALFREAKKWAKSKGAEKLHFRSTTEYDIEPLAKRIGAEIEYPAYSVRL